MGFFLQVVPCLAQALCTKLVMCQNILGHTLILVQVTGPRLLGSPGSWGIPSVAPVPASSVWCHGWGAAQDPGKAVVEASIQPPTDLRVAGALIPAAEGQGELWRANFWTSLLRFFKILGFSLWRSWWSGKGYWRLFQLNLLEHQDC